MRTWPDPGKEIVTNQSWPGYNWTCGVYYECLIALYQTNKQPRCYAYAVDWDQKQQ